jgi:hypothetical protein
LTREFAGKSDKDLFLGGVGSGLQPSDFVGNYILDSLGGETWPISSIGIPARSTISSLCAIPCQDATLFARNAGCLATKTRKPARFSTPPHKGTEVYKSHFVGVQSLGWYRARLQRSDVAAWVNSVHPTSQKRDVGHPAKDKYGDSSLRCGMTNEWQEQIPSLRCGMTTKLRCGMTSERSWWIEEESHVSEARRGAPGHPSLWVGHGWATPRSAFYEQLSAITTVRLILC